MSKKETKKEVETIRFFHKKQTVKLLEANGTRVKLFVEPETISGAPVILGFPNIGITPVLTCTYLVEDLNLPLIGSIETKNIVPKVIISRVGEPCQPIRIFGDKRIIVICSELKVSDQALSELSSAILLFCTSVKTEVLWCIEGKPVEKVDVIEREEMQFITTNEKLSTLLLSKGHKVIQGAVITGVTGAVLSDVATSGVDVDICCMLSPASSFYPDAWSSVMVIRLLNTVYTTWQSDTSKLEANATAVENKVKFLLSKTVKATTSSPVDSYIF